jgi:toxin ParE1/3/4
MSKLRVARSATADLDEIWTYLARGGSVEAAERFVSYLTSQFTLLARNPGLGRKRSDLRPGLLSFPVGNYRIYYRRQAGGVVRILHVRHAARDERKLFPKS